MSINPLGVDQATAAQEGCVFPELPALPDVLAALVSGTHPRELFETMQPEELRSRAVLGGAGGRSIRINPLISLPLAHESLDEGWEALESRGLLPPDAMTTRMRRFCLHNSTKQSKDRDAHEVSLGCVQRPHDLHRPVSLTSMILWASAGAERLAQAEALARTFYERLARSVQRRAAVLALDGVSMDTMPPFVRVQWHSLSWAASPWREVALSEQQDRLLIAPLAMQGRRYALSFEGTRNTVAIHMARLRGQPGLLRDIPTFHGRYQADTTLSRAYAMSTVAPHLAESPYSPIIELWHLGFGVLSFFDGTVHLGFAVS